MTDMTLKFATFERFGKNGKWQPAEFESFRPGEYMRSSNAPAKVILIEGIPSPVLNDPNNWEVHGRHLSEDEQRELSIIE